MRSDTEPTDGDLVRRARTGDGAAFEALVRRHTRPGLAVARSVLYHTEDAEDVCQDAWIRALERLEDCRDPDRFIFWFLKIVRNRAINKLDARRVRAAEPLDAHDPTGGEGPDVEYRRGRTRERLVEALAALTEAQRAVTLLHDLEGLSHRQIAEALGMSEVMSRQHLFRARKALMDRLGGPRGQAGMNQSRSQ